MSTETRSRAARTAQRAVPRREAADAPGPLRGLRHVLALAGRSLVKTARTPEALLDVTVQPVVFLLLFTYVFGGAISGGDRHEYLQALVPGVIAQSLALGGFALGQNLNADIENGVFDRFRSLPIARSAPLVGAVLADVVRYLLVFTVLVVAGSVLGFRVQTGALDVVAALGVSVAFGLSFCWISVLVGMLARSPGAVQGVMFMLVMPLTFGSNVFVPADSMPGWLEAFVRVNPVTHLVDVVRGLLLGGPVAGPLTWTVAWMVGLVAVFAPLAVRAYRRRA
ncbi:ABC transporter permease [Kineococcus glutinatus]|uniref:Transport permease protein n=1 Tax=Kineococcus glutinatus TaxID=1070872 RepID=A0ABP8VJC4_9ACTN